MLASILYAFIGRRYRRNREAILLTTSTQSGITTARLTFTPGWYENGNLDSQRIQRLSLHSAIGLRAVQHTLDLDGLGLRLHKAHAVIADQQPKFVRPFQLGYVALACCRKTQWGGEDPLHRRNIELANVSTG